MKRANGTGSIVKLSGKRRKKYWARVTNGFDENGKQLYKSLKCHRTYQLADWEIKAYLDNPALFDKITLGYLYEKWSTRHFKDKKSVKTKQMYETAWNHLKMLRKKDIKDIRVEDIEQLLSPEASKSKNKQIKSLAVQIYDYALENDYIAKNYAEFIKVVGRNPKQKVVFKEKDERLLWKHMEVEYVDTILILLNTGYRIGELLTLEKEFINTDLWYAQHGNKTEAGKNRIVPFPDKIVGLIQRRYEQAEKYLIERNGKKISVDYYRKHIFNPLKEKLGLDAGLTPHSTRHYYASQLNKVEGNKTTIKNLLGHTSYSITEKIYTHQEIQELINSANKL